jgi:hypothetical protein
MAKGSELRRTANLYRRMAEVPTEGGHHEDRLLFALAEQLEQEASSIEVTSEAPTPSRGGRRVRRRPYLGP